MRLHVLPLALLSTTQATPVPQNDLTNTFQSAINKLECRVVNFLVNAGREAATATSFCSSYLSIATATSTSTSYSTSTVVATVTAPTITVTAAPSTVSVLEIHGTQTTTVVSTVVSSSTPVTTVYPATVQVFERCRVNKRAVKAAAPCPTIWSALAAKALSTACSCLSIPKQTTTVTDRRVVTTVSTSTVQPFATITPVRTVTVTGSQAQSGFASTSTAPPVITTQSSTTTQTVVSTSTVTAATPTQTVFDLTTADGRFVTLSSFPQFGIYNNAIKTSTRPDDGWYLTADGYLRQFRTGLTLSGFSLDNVQAFDTQANGFSVTRAATTNNNDRLSLAYRQPPEGDAILYTLFQGDSIYSRSPTDPSEATEKDFLLFASGRC